MASVVTAVSRSPLHTLVKASKDSIKLVAGLGVEGDAHQGATVKHRSRVARDPTEPNLRQVHLIHAELHAELGQAGFAVEPGQMGENVTTSGPICSASSPEPALPRRQRGRRGDGIAQSLRPARQDPKWLDVRDVGARRRRQPRPKSPRRP